MEHGKIISVLLRTKYQKLKASYIEKKVFFNKCLYNPVEHISVLDVLIDENLTWNMEKSYQFY